MRIRLCRNADLPAVQTLLADSPQASPWALADGSGYHSLIAEADGEIIGFAMARVVCVGEAELLNVAILPPWRRRGVAERLIRQALLFSPGDWFLEVREGNTAAIQLYEKIGFFMIGKRPAYYADTGEHAIVMTLRAC